MAFTGKLSVDGYEFYITNHPFDSIHLESNANLKDRAFLSALNKALEIAPEAIAAYQFIEIVEIWGFRESMEKGIKYARYCEPGELFAVMRMGQRAMAQKYVELPPFAIEAHQWMFGKWIDWMEKNPKGSEQL